MNTENISIPPLIEKEVCLLSSPCSESSSASGDKSVMNMIHDGLQGMKDYVQVSTHTEWAAFRAMAGI